jgi:hypothetical protein
MKITTRTILCLLALSFAAVTVYAQSKGDWQAVKDLHYDAAIKIYAEKKVNCNFRSATDQQLTCARKAPLPFVKPQLMIFDRSRVREVHREHPKINGEIGAILGGVGGGLLSGGDLSMGVMILMGGAIGTVTGPHVPIIPGKVIYKR